MSAGLVVREDILFWIRGLVVGREGTFLGPMIQGSTPHGFDEEVIRSLVNFHFTSHYNK